MQEIVDGGYKLAENGYFDVTASEEEFNPGGVLTEFMNTGGDTVYFSHYTGVGATDYELRPGSTFRVTNKVFFITGGATARVKWIQTRGVGN